jgi:hypothetical protein
MISPDFRPAFSAGLPATIPFGMITSQESDARLLVFAIFLSIGEYCTPRNGRLIVLYFVRDVRIYFMSFDESGIAKPSPFAQAATAVLIPTTFPSRLTSGHPLFPGLMAASVWRSHESCSTFPHV